MKQASASRERVERVRERAHRLKDSVRTVILRALPKSRRVRPRDRFSKGDSTPENRETVRSTRCFGWLSWIPSAGPLDRILSRPRYGVDGASSIGGITAGTSADPLLATYATVTNGPGATNGGACSRSVDHTCHCGVACVSDGPLTSRGRGSSRCLCGGRTRPREDLRGRADGFERTRSTAEERFKARDLAKRVAVVAATRTALCSVTE
jgi:hypothetical protein